MRHTAIYLLALLLHESGRAPVQEGLTLAHAVQSPQARPFIEWPDLPAEVQHGRKMTADRILDRFHVGDPFPDLGAEPVSVDELAAAIHEAERAAVEAGYVLVKLGRPWVPFRELPEQAQEGRRRQARFLMSRAFFAPRNTAPRIAELERQIAEATWLRDIYDRASTKPALLSNTTGKRWAIVPVEPDKLLTSDITREDLLVLMRQAQAERDRYQAEALTADMRLQGLANVHNSLIDKLSELVAHHRNNCSDIAHMVGRDA